MNSFTYARAQDVQTALQEKTTALDGRFIAGGTNLTDLMKVNVEQPSHVIDIRRLPFNQITETEVVGLRLGALVTNAETAYNKQIEQRYPLLAKAILAGASAQLRNRATNGGNPLQRTRCYYFYDTATACNKREPGSGCSAIKGYNRIHAILGTSESCIAVHPSDMAVALTALDATVNVNGPNGERSIPFLDFHRLPGDTPHLDTNLGPDEIITSIDLPAQGFAEYNTYLKLRDRASYAFALVSVAAALELEGTIIKEVRIALGGVAHKPWRQPEVEANLVGKEVNAENLQNAAEALLTGAKGYGHNNFKIELAKRAIVRALLQAAKMEDSK
ncbi:FAD-binding molybdopterin dehydrogenase [Adhaeribacter arboris]|uniref:FAD-binding molybdopterin dehydrogenase n=1 Tax=Adhaeribacter arboris TaxID=2072846 RepID=A0A2T2YB09_9BACT|nr:xanthine dehydrogenase family protein subunit M [Adhaeribacter arboris]PSR52683.1 FAD-binding molybdopterin dehydrogenase [Adhaeribacter arboris]